MDAFFVWLESSDLSLWVRGTTGAAMAFPIILCFHALGMGFLVGTATVLNLRILGLFPDIPLLRLQRFLPFALLGLVINAISGVLLLIAYPTKALTNPLFYLKLLLIALALWSLAWCNRQVLSEPASNQGVLPARYRHIAIATCIAWAGAIVAGRLLAYTYSQLLSI